MYDEECWFYNKESCKNGDLCLYKHCESYATSQYQLLLHHHKTTNNLLQQILSSIQTLNNTLSMANNNIETVKADNKIQTPDIEFKYNSDKPAINAPTPKQYILEVVDCTPTPPAVTADEPIQTVTPDPTPTDVYFRKTNEEPHILCRDDDKTKFVTWILEYITVDTDDIDLGHNASEIVMCDLEDNDIITGNSAMGAIYAMLKIYGIKYRKILNVNDEKDL